MERESALKSILGESGRIIKDKFKRYLPAEAIATASAFAAGAVAANYSDGNPISIGYFTMVGENAGFYGTMILNQVREDLQLARQSGERYSPKTTFSKIISEFGIAEAIDSPITRPMSTALFTNFWGPEIGITAGKISADLCFYLIAGTCHELRERKAKRKR